MNFDRCERGEGEGRTAFTDAVHTQLVCFIPFPDKVCRDEDEGWDAVSCIRYFLSIEKGETHATQTSEGYSSTEYAVEAMMLMVVVQRKG